MNPIQIDTPQANADWLRVQSTPAPQATWSKTEARKRISAAAKLAREAEARKGYGFPSYARVEVGERIEPQYVTGPAGIEVTQAMLWESDLQEYVLPKDLRAGTVTHKGHQLPYASQALGVGYICHLYFTDASSQWGELLNVVTVWLGDNLNGPQVVA